MGAEVDSTSEVLIKLSPIMWIHHKDHSQTSFLVQTIAEILDELGHFPGSFFSTSDGPKGTRRIIPTLAFQLAQNVPGARSPVAQTVAQICRFLNYNPRHKSRNSGKIETGGIPKVFLIHGLEDSDDAKHFQLSLLDAFSDALTLLSSNNIPHRLLLIGQDSSHIRRCILNANLPESVIERPIKVETPLGGEEGDRDTKGEPRKRGEVLWSLMATLQAHSRSVAAITFSADPRYALFFKSRRLDAWLHGRVLIGGQPLVPEEMVANDGTMLAWLIAMSSHKNYHSTPDTVLNTKYFDENGSLKLGIPDETLESRIVTSGVVLTDDIPGIIKFIEACLTLGPRTRPSPRDLFRSEWVKPGHES